MSYDNFDSGKVGISGDNVDDKRIEQQQIIDKNKAFLEECADEIHPELLKKIKKIKEIQK